jgi:hypothetical protein
MYSIEALFLAASWVVLAPTLDEMMELIEFVSSDVENKPFYFAIASVTVGAIVLAVFFWFRGAARQPTAGVLTVGGMSLFVISAWQLSMTLTIGLGVALWFGILNVISPNKPLNRTPESAAGLRRNGGGGAG